jgi:hypothetical protein
MWSFGSLPDPKRLEKTAKARSGRRNFQPLPDKLTENASEENNQQDHQHPPKKDNALVKLPDSSFLLVTKNTFVHIEDTPADSSSRLRSRSGPGRWAYLSEDDASEEDNWCFTSIVKGSVRPAMRVQPAADKRAAPAVSSSVPCSPYTASDPTPYLEARAAAKATKAKRLSAESSSCARTTNLVDKYGTPSTCASSFDPNHEDIPWPLIGEPEESMAALAHVFREYIRNENDAGCTLMWHSLPSKCHVEPDLVPILRDLGAHDVEYIYLPVNHWERTRAAASKCRNKGYAFVHFASAESAKAFTQNVAKPVDKLKKQTSTTEAVFQGISANIAQLLRAPHKRTSDGVIYVKMDGEMRGVYLGSLRKLQAAAGIGLPPNGDEPEASLWRSWQ